MPKHLLELLNSINTQKALVANLVKEGKLDEAKEAKAQLVTMQEKFDLLKDIEEQPITGGNKATPAEGDPEDSEQSFAQAVRALASGRLFNMNAEGTGADGGYTVPEDIQTRINRWREDRFELSSLVATEVVSAPSGARTYQTKAAHTGFQSVDEAGKIPAVNGPQFERITYTIAKYAGYLPVTNELLADSDANITSVLVEWLGEEDVATRNALVLAAVARKTPVVLAGLDDIKYAINVTLGQAYAAGAAIVTNDNGLQYLDTLKDENKRYLLQPDINPDTPFSMTLAVGARKVPVVVIPNTVLPGTYTYALTEDQAPNATKTYYTRTGEGTKASPYVYTAVTEPASASIGTYYEGTLNIPFIIGNLKEYTRIYDQQKLTLMTSNVAAVGTGLNAINAFEQDLTIFRGIDRLDIEVIDADAIVNGALQVGE